MCECERPCIYCEKCAPHAACEFPEGDCDDCADLLADPASAREHNVTMAREAEASPPNVRGLLLFGQRKGAAWQAFRAALAAEVEHCNVREEPELLTETRIRALAMESARKGGG